jgi:hypothetical protein
VEQNVTAMNVTARIQIIAAGKYALEHLGKIAGNGHLFNRKDNFTLIDKKSASTT